MPDGKLSPEQIQNWRRVLPSILGPLAQALSDEDIQRFRDDMQRQTDDMAAQMALDGDTKDNA
jgi:hypothetical protein